VGALNLQDQKITDRKKQWLEIKDHIVGGIEITGLENDGLGHIRVCK